jgi:hypothetical protein
MGEKNTKPHTRLFPVYTVSQVATTGSLSQEDLHKAMYATFERLPGQFRIFSAPLIRPNITFLNVRMAPNCGPFLSHCTAHYFVSAPYTCFLVGIARVVIRMLRSLVMGITPPIPRVDVPLKRCLVFMKDMNLLSQFVDAFNLFFTTCLRVASLVAQDPYILASLFGCRWLGW